MMKGGNSFSSGKISVGCLNTRSICNKTLGVLELIKDNDIDICCITETWLKKKDSSKFAEIHDHGFDILSAPRKGKGGGVAFIFNPMKLKPVRNNVSKFKSFEALECIVKGVDKLIRFCVIYRSTQAATSKDPTKYNDTKVKKFIEDFEIYLDLLLEKTGVPVICGDFNFKVNDNKDPSAKKFMDLYQAKGFKQHVNGSTHKDGNKLDLILTLRSISDSIPVTDIKIETNQVVSDHYLVHFQLPIKLKVLKGPEKETKEYREFHKLDIDQFKSDLKVYFKSSPGYSSLDQAVELYHNSVQYVLNTHAPLISRSFIVGKSPWWNNDCQNARRERRKAKRKLDKFTTADYKDTFNEKCVDAEIIINRARDTFYDKKLSSVARDTKGTYKVIGRLLDKEFGADNLPNGIDDNDIADNLKTFFEQKIKSIYSEITEDVKSRKLDTLCNSNVDANSRSNLSTFKPVTEPELLKIIQNMPNKSCDIDVLPMWLFKECVPELKDLILSIVNMSLTNGIFPSSLKNAMIRPSLKKVGLDPDVLKNYRPISNLSYISKIIEKCVHQQMTSYIEKENLFAKHQSGYRKFHSCETAVTKIHNDILIMMDKRSNVVLLLLDLSAAFDTINHSLLLKKLQSMYGINGIVLSWFKSYLSGRSFKVKVKMSSSSPCVFEIGVPQGSILGPLLFILYTKDLEEIVEKYGFSIHLYADDTQIYLAFDVHSSNPDFTSIKSCFKDIKDWMALNFLKLNEDKTLFLDIGYYQSQLTSLSLDTEELEPSLKAKNLGFYFDHQMSLDSEITATQKTCNIQIRNLWRIARHLNFDLKIQLVKSCVLSHLDYCNAAYGALTEANIQKLQKLQNSAVRFVFNLYGKKKYEHITPYLKKLHFLPVRFRIMYKTALLVFKCLNNLAPKYLTQLIDLRNTNSHSLRNDDDFFLLNLPPVPNLKRTNGAFPYYGPFIWNSLPYA